METALHHIKKKDRDTNNMISCEEFMDIIHRAKLIMFPAFELRDIFRTNVLGTSRWKSLTTKRHKMFREKWLPEILGAIEHKPEGFNGRLVVPGAKASQSILDAPIQKQVHVKKPAEVHATKPAAIISHHEHPTAAEQAGPKHGRRNSRAGSEPHRDPDVIAVPDSTKKQHKKAATASFDANSDGRSYVSPRHHEHEHDKHKPTTATSHSPSHPSQSPGNERSSNRTRNHHVANESNHDYDHKHTHELAATTTGRKRAPRNANSSNRSSFGSDASGPRSARSDLSDPGAATTPRSRAKTERRRRSSNSNSVASN